MEKVVKISAKLFLFKSLSFPNRLSYRCQIGPKWKLFRSTFWEKLNQQTFFEFWMHLVNWKSILQTMFPETTKLFMFGGITLWKYCCLCFSPKTTSKYLSFETNLGSVAQTVKKWERFTERQSQQNSLFWQNLPFNSYESWTTSLLNPTLLKDESLWSSHWCLIRTHHNYP